MPNRRFVNCQYHIKHFPYYYKYVYSYIKAVDTMSRYWWQPRAAWHYRLLSQCTLRSGISRLLCGVNWLQFINVVMHLCNTQVHHKKCTKPPHSDIFIPCILLPSLLITPHPSRSDWHTHISRVLPCLNTHACTRTPTHTHIHPTHLYPDDGTDKTSLNAILF